MSYATLLKFVLKHLFNFGFQVPIINEDIKKQKNIDKSHQPPFSDAYLNGMSKKRRLEHKPDDDESCD